MTRFGIREKTFSVKFGKKKMERLPNIKKSFEILSGGDHFSATQVEHVISPETD